METENARKIILNAVKTTKPLWENFGEKWDDIDHVFLSRAYETQGFHLYKFVNHLKKHEIYSIMSLGSILDNYNGERKYRRDFSGSLKSPFFQDLNNGKYDKEGQNFYKCAKEFKGSFGRGYWRNLWWMLVCCHDLKEKFNASFSYYLKRKYSKFKGLKEVSDADFINISINDWEDFLKTYPWDELYGVGPNVFDYIMGDIEDLKFVENSYKLDLANKHFLIVTGIFKEKELNRDKVIVFLESLNLSYKIREINKGLYSYCAETAADSYGFCRENKPEKCQECAVDDVCEKNF